MKFINLSLIFLFFTTNVFAQSKIILECKVTDESFQGNQNINMKPFNLIFEINLKDGSFTSDKAVVLAPFMNDANKPKFIIKDDELVITRSYSGGIFNEDYSLNINRYTGKGSSKYKTSRIENGKTVYSKHLYSLECIKLNKKLF